MIEQAKFTYFLLVESFEIQENTIEHAAEKQSKIIEDAAEKQTKAL